MRVIIILIFLSLLSVAEEIVGQVVNSIIVQPNNSTNNDSIFIISDFSYYGNCSEGLVQAQIIQGGSDITIYPEYCGYGDSMLCNAVDTFSLGVLPIGNYSVDIEYHQGTVCGGSFDEIIANIDTSFTVRFTSTKIKNFKEFDIEIFPNPILDFVRLTSKETIKEIKLFDLVGQESKIEFLDNYIDLRLLKTGLYILSVQLENGNFFTKQIVKQ